MAAPVIKKMKFGKPMYSTQIDFQTFSSPDKQKLIRYRDFMTEYKNVGKRMAEASIAGDMKTFQRLSDKYEKMNQKRRKIW